MSDTFSLASVKLTSNEVLEFSHLAKRVKQLLQDDYGFDSALLFLLHPESQELELVNSESKLSFSLSTNSLLIDSYLSGEIRFGYSSKQVFEDKESVSMVNTIHSVLVPLTIKGQSIGVFVLESKQQSLSELEQSFLREFANAFALPLAITWQKELFSQTNAKLQELNYDYRGLIEVKQAFLEQVQDVLVHAMSKHDLTEDERIELISCLSYLQSVLLVSTSTLNRHQEK